MCDHRPSFYFREVPVFSLAIGRPPGHVPGSQPMDGVDKTAAPIVLVSRQENGVRDPLRGIRSGSGGGAGLLGNPQSSGRVIGVPDR